MSVDSVDSMRTRVKDLRAAVRGRSHEFEQLNDLPTDVFAALAATGVYRTFVPREFGGLGGAPTDWFEAVLNLATDDAAVAWVAAQGAVQHAWLAMFAGADFARNELARPGALLATSIAGAATLEPAGEGAFELAGSWRFLSGVSGATLIGGLAIVRRPGQPLEARFAVVPAAQARIEASWENVGLRGSGSHDASAGPVVIDAAQTWLVQIGVPNLDHPAACFGRGTWPISVSVAGVQLGIARRALDEFAQIARAKAQLPVQAGTGAPLATNPAIQRAFARAEAQWLAAHEGVQQQLRTLWDRASAGSFDHATGRRCQMVAAAAAWMSAEIVRTVYTLAGTTAQRDGHPLQRCFRDAHVLTAHISVNEGTLEAIGREMLASEG